MDIVFDRCIARSKGLEFQRNWFLLKIETHTHTQWTINSALFMAVCVLRHISSLFSGGWKLCKFLTINLFLVPIKQLLKRMEYVLHRRPESNRQPSLA